MVVRLEASPRHANPSDGPPRGDLRPPRRPRNSNAQCESRGSGVGTSGRTASPLTDEDVEEGLALRSADGVTRTTATPLSVSSRGPRVRSVRRNPLRSVARGDPRLCGHRERPESGVPSVFGVALRSQPALTPRRPSVGRLDYPWSLAAGSWRRMRPNSLSAQ
jgi:hypothetical protein